MNPHQRLAVSLAAGAVLLTACSSGTAPKSAAHDTSTSASSAALLGPETVKAPNGTQVPVSLYRYYVTTALKKDPNTLSDANRAEVLDSLANLQLLANAAEAKGLQKERTVAVELALQRMQLLARTMLNRYVQEHGATESEIKAAYEKNLTALTAPRYKAKNIIVGSEADAKAIIAKLDKGANFADLAKKDSTGAAADKGGELGWFTTASTVKPFADAVATLKPGEYTETPVKTRFGWHVILLEDKKAAAAPALAEVHDQMAQFVNKQKAEAFIKSLRDKTPATATTN